VRICTVADLTQPLAIFYAKKMLSPIRVTQVLIRIIFFSMVVSPIIHVEYRLFDMENLLIHAHFYTRTNDNFKILSLRGIGRKLYKVL